MTNLLFDIKPEALIEGLSYQPDFITPDQEVALLAEIDAQPWRHDLKRRVQHYGYRYDYTARKVSKDSYLGSLPDWLDDLARRLVADKIFPQKPDQVIVNEYLPGQGIAAHIDCVPCFGAVIASLSLGGGAMMQFTKGDEKRAQYLEPRSLVTLYGPARYEWQHSIPARKSDMVDGMRVPRSRRISLTFRTVILKT